MAALFVIPCFGGENGQPVQVPNHQVDLLPQIIMMHGLLAVVNEPGVFAEEQKEKHSKAARKENSSLPQNQKRVVCRGTQGQFKRSNR